MYIVIGKITEGGKDKAYKIFDFNTQESELLTRNEVREKLLAEDKIIGLELTADSYGNLNIRKNHHFMWKEGIIELRGDGLLEKEEDADIKMSIGTIGYKEYRCFVVINPMSKISVISEKEVRERINSGNTIVGIKLASDGKLMSYVKNELTEKWMQSAGFTKVDGYWTQE